MDEIVETICHGAMEGGSNIFQAKGHDLVSECAPWGCECRLVTVFVPDLDLVVSGKAVHEGKDLMFGARIDDLIDEGCWEVIFGTCPIQIMEVCANADGTLFFIQGNMI